VVDHGTQIHALEAVDFVVAHIRRDLSGCSWVVFLLVMPMSTSNKRVGTFQRLALLKSKDEGGQSAERLWDDKLRKLLVCSESLESRVVAPESASMQRHNRS